MTSPLLRPAQEEKVFMEDMKDMEDMEDPFEEGGASTLHSTRGTRVQEDAPASKKPWPQP